MRIPGLHKQGKGSQILKHFQIPEGSTDCNTEPHVAAQIAEVAMVAIKVGTFTL